MSLNIKSAWEREGSLERRELHGQPQLLAFSTPVNPFMADRAKSNLKTIVGSSRAVTTTERTLVVPLPLTNLGVYKSNASRGGLGNPSAALGAVML